MTSVCEFDVVLRHGLIYDGRGGEPFLGNIGVTGDEIRYVGPDENICGKLDLDVRGYSVCPGFIDAHSHSDTYVLIEPSCASKIYQGVTTEIAGNCGTSAAPRVGAYQLPADWQEKHYPATWSSVAEYRALFERVKPAVNLRLLVGHNTLRACVMGYAARQATQDEIRNMLKLLEKAMEEGAAGISTGLIYSPGMYATREEVVTLVRAAANRGGIYATHMRSEGTRLLEALEEALDIAERAAAPLQISHLKTSGKRNWHLLEPVLERIHKAQTCGMDVTADRYPYTAASTDLDVILPEWAAGGGREEVLRRLHDPEIRWAIREEILEGRPPDYWDLVRVGTTHRPENASFRGMTLREVAERLGVEPVDAALYLMESDELKTTAIFFGMSEENMWKILKQPWVMIGSDASVRAPWGVLGTDHPHPRAYGAFAKFLRAALDGRTVSVAEAIRKMTSLPAARFGLQDRGVIAEQKKADLVVFDPQTVSDTATYEKPHQLARGIRFVWVNGVLTLDEGKLTNKRAGQFLC